MVCIWQDVFDSLHCLIKYLKSMWPLLLPLLFLLPGLNAFPYPSAEAVYSDLTTTHYPNAYFLRRAVIEDHEIPLWSPTILSGYPFAANPLSGLWYPPGWLALCLPLPFGFNLILSIHLIFGGLGMYRLLHKEGVGHLPALFGAIAFESMPKWFAHYGAGHLTLLYAVAWTPWLLGFRDEIIAANPLRITKGGYGLRYIAVRTWFTCMQPGVFLAMIFLADPRWAPYAGLMWWAYVLSHSQAQVKIRQESPNTHSHISNPREVNRSTTHSLLLLIGVIIRKARSYVKSMVQRLETIKNPLISLVNQTILATLLSAPLGLPLLEYTRLSTRASLKTEDILAFSLPWSHLLGLIFPDFGGFQEWMLYPGGSIFVMALLAVIWKNHPAKKKFWIFILLITILFSLGSNLPFLSALANLPGFNLLRVPTRALFLTGMACAVLAAFGLDRLLQGVASVEFRRAGLGLTGLVAFILVLTGTFYVLTGVFSTSFTLGAAAITTTAIWVGLLLWKKIALKIWVVGIFGIALLDFAAVDLASYAPRSPEIVLSEAEATAKYITDNPIKSYQPQSDLNNSIIDGSDPLFRVYSPSYSIPQQTGARYELELTDGVDPLQLKGYANFMDKASGVLRTGYSVTLPPFAGDPKSINATYIPDPQLMGLLNVGYVVSEFELALDRLNKVAQFGQTRIYENDAFLPRVWITQEELSQVNSLTGLPSISDYPRIEQMKPNKLTLHAKGPGLLVLSEVVYPGWQVWVDGKRSEIQPVFGIFRGVMLEEGEHDLVFVFRPLSVYLGLVIALLGIGYLITGSIHANS